MRALARAFLFMASAVWLAASSAAQTVNIHYRFTDFQTNLANVSQVSVSPIPTNGAYNALLSQYFQKFTRGNTPSLTNGEMTLSNALKGFIYRTTFTARGGDQTYDILASTNLPDGATIDAWTNVVTSASDTVDGFAGYSQAAANAKFLEKSNGTASALSLGTDLDAGGHSLNNVTDVTDTNGNSLLGAGSGSGEANVGANIGTGVGIYAGKSGVSLNLRTVATSGGATASTNANTLTISADAPGAATAATNGYPWGSLYDPVNSALAVQSALAATNAAIQAQLQASNTVYQAAFEAAGAATAATNSLYSTLNAKKIDAVNGTATNLNIGGDGLSFNLPDQAPLVVRMTNANVNAMSLSLLSSTNDQTAAGVHISTFNAGSLTTGQSVDIGLWSQGFGAGYSGTFAFDLYNRDAGHSSATSNQPPNFDVSVTDSREGSVLRHPIFGVDSTNLWFEMYYQTNGSREIIPGFIWDRTIGVMPFRNSAKAITGSGTVSGSGSTITGVGTKFGNTIFSEAGYGDFIAVGNTSYLIRSVASSTSVTVQGTISPTFSGSNYVIYKGAITWININGTPISVIGGDGNPIIGHGSGDLAWLRLIGATKDYWLEEGASGEFLIHNVTDNSNPFVLTPGGALTVTSLSGSLNASQLTSGNVPSARLGTNDGTASDGWVLSRSGQNQKWIAASGSGTVTSVDVAENGRTSSGAITGSGTITLTRTGDENFLGFGATNLGFLKVTNTAQIGGTVSAGTMVVTNGSTNLSLTASTLIQADANKKYASIANASGVLTNNGSGSMGFDNTFAHTNQLLGTVLSAGTHIKTDASTNLVSSEDATGYTNTIAYTHEGTATNITVSFNGTLQTFTITNGPTVFLSYAGANGSVSYRIISTNFTTLQFLYQPKWIAGSNNVITNGVLSLTSYGGTNATQIEAALKENQ